MRHNKKISANLEKEILKRSAHGDSGPQIVAWLLAEHGIKISRQAITDLLKKTRVERSEVAKAVVKDELTGQVTSDLQILMQSLRRVERLERRLHAKANRFLTIAEKATKGEPGPDGAPLTIEAVVAASEGANDAAAIALKASAEVRAQVDTKLEFAGAKEDVVVTYEPTPQDAAKAIRERFNNKVEGPAVEPAEEPTEEPKP